MSMEFSTPAPQFAYPHPYHNPGSGVLDGNTMVPNMHSNYQAMLQPPVPSFRYHRTSPEGNPVPHHYTAIGSPSMYGHGIHTSPPPSTPPNSTGPSSAHSQYPTTAAFNYPQIRTPQYNFPSHQVYSNSPPIYSQYPNAPYVQHHPASPDAEQQGTWWYIPPPSGGGPPTQQYDVSYQGHYPMPYVHQHTPPSPPSPLAYAIPALPVLPSSPSPPVPSGSSIPPLLESNTREASSEKHIVRRSYHPNPPSHRSDWVMWAGNVPSDATHDELWRFFNQPPSSDADAPSSPGVLSVFLIARSSCAFINFESEFHLSWAIGHFNGVALRPTDTRCPRLLCRVRKKDDDLKAGVGGQRGSGIHTKWIKEQKALKATESSDASDLSASDDRPPSAASDEQISLTLAEIYTEGEGNPRRTAKHSSSSGSTTSSFLTRYFPQRYFILKSLTQVRNSSTHRSPPSSEADNFSLQYDLDLSVEKGLWATQKHNEGILDQAFRTSQEVYLIFSVNKSGEFYGYAR
ncbi:hypothetical protein H0H81_010839 [Sphagnurus paluster]|uniref:YTH domain-containing protein n=1 Tax=Sphagnurus paluster TaxID=117069 RepID=A0A9P7GVD6_9AGAR|nr:hypothetical protein H0H81_010839 [Sphagnurus paluster]